jgi:ribosome-associated protein
MQFSLDGNEFVALCDLLKLTDIYQSGGHAKVMIAEGLVKVDGETETRKRCKIRVGQIVSAEGVEIEVTL